MPRLLSKASQALSLAGPWQWLRGYLGQAQVNITGCCMKCGQSFAVLTWCPHRCGCAFAPCGFTATPFMSCAPPRLHAAPACSSCRAEDKSMCWPWLRHRRRHSGQALRAVLMVGPARPPSPCRPRQAPLGPLPFFFLFPSLLLRLLLLCPVGGLALARHKVPTGHLVSGLSPRGAPQPHATTERTYLH